MEPIIKLFNYNGNSVTFRNKTGTTYVNATEMAKPFNKFPNDYLRLPSTILLIKAIAGKSLISDSQLVITRPGSPMAGGGTWLHEDIAIDFAQWLSIDFKLWCNDKLKEVLTTGQIKLPTGKEFAQMYIDAENRNEALMLEIEHSKKVIQEQMPKSIFHDAVAASDSTISVGELAKLIKQNGKDIGQNRLFSLLREKRYLMKSRGDNIPTQMSMDRGLLELQEDIISRNGKTIVTKTPRVTGKGQTYFIKMFLSKETPYTANPHLSATNTFTHVNRIASN